MYGCESWTIKKAECRRIDAFELWCWRKLLRVPWTARRSNQSILKETSPEWFIGRTEAEAETETPVLWPPDAKNWLIGKDPDAGKDWRREEKGMTEDEMVGGHHWLNQHEFELALGVGDGQGSLACCSPRGHSQTWLSNWNELNWTDIYCFLTVCFPGGSVGKESACRRSRFDPWVEKIPLEEEMATHSSILAWSIQWTEEPTVLGVTQSDSTERLTLALFQVLNSVTFPILQRRKTRPKED